MKAITLVQAKILLGEIAYHDTIERISNGFKFTTTVEFVRECKETFITDEQIQMCIGKYGSIKNEGTQAEAKEWAIQNL